MPKSKSRKSKKPKEPSSKQKPGFFPCFAKYDHDKYPLRDIYDYRTSGTIKKIKLLMGAFIDSHSPYALKDNISNHIETIRPNSKEAKQIINRISSVSNWPYDLYRIDYGDEKFRVLFGLSNEQRMAYVFAFDVYHQTFR